MSKPSIITDSPTKYTKTNCCFFASFRVIRGQKTSRAAQAHKQKNYHGTSTNRIEASALIHHLANGPAPCTTNIFRQKRFRSGIILLRFHRLRTGRQSAGRRKNLAEHYREMGSGKGSATALVFGFKTNPVDASFLNGHMIRAMDYNDIYWKADDRR